MDPEKSYNSQVKATADAGPPLKDDPDYAKFFKVCSYYICFCFLAIHVSSNPLSFSFFVP